MTIVLESQPTNAVPDLQEAVLTLRHVAEVGLQANMERGLAPRVLVRTKCVELIVIKKRVDRDLDAVESNEGIRSYPGAPSPTLTRL